MTTKWWKQIKSGASRNPPSPVLTSLLVSMYNYHILQGIKKDVPEDRENNMKSPPYVSPPYVSKTVFTIGFFKGALLDHLNCCRDSYG